MNMNNVQQLSCQVLNLLANRNFISTLQVNKLRNKEHVYKKFCANPDMFFENFKQTQQIFI